MFSVVYPLALLLPIMPASGQEPCTIDPVVATAAEEPILASFNQRVDAYMQVHNDVERAVAPAQQFEDPEDMFATFAAMRSGIRAARGDAQRGAIFTDEVGALLRARLESRLAECHLRVEDVLAFINEERLTAKRPAVYQRFPWALGSAMPPLLLPALPVLPAELQYRFADRDLVIVDMHADMVVDILVDALPDPGGKAPPRTSRR